MVPGPEEAEGVPPSSEGCRGKTSKCRLEPLAHLVLTVGELRQSCAMTCIRVRHDVKHVSSMFKVAVATERHA